MQQSKMFLSNTVSYFISQLRVSVDTEYFSDTGTCFALLCFAVTKLTDRGNAEFYNDTDKENVFNVD